MDPGEGLPHAGHAPLGGVPHADTRRHRGRGRQAEEEDAGLTRAWIVSSIQNSRTIWQDFENAAHHPYPTGSSSWTRSVSRSDEMARGSKNGSETHGHPECAGGLLRAQVEVPARGYVQASVPRPPAPELLPFAFWFLPFALIARTRVACRSRSGSSPVPMVPATPGWAAQSRFDLPRNL